MLDCIGNKFAHDQSNILAIECPPADGPHCKVPGGANLTRDRRKLSLDYDRRPCRQRVVPRWDAWPGDGIMFSARQRPTRNAASDRRQPNPERCPDCNLSKTDADLQSPLCLL